MRVLDLGLKDYEEAWRFQKELAARRAAGLVSDTLVLTEHPPVYTQGVSSRAAVPGPLPHPLHQVERGGEVTYHGPGQLVGYPIVHLAEAGLAVGDYLRLLETVLAEAVGALGLEAGRLRGFTGVWARGSKIASIGVAVKSGVAYHGFALNVDMDLSGFARIFPCNLEPGSLGSVARLLGRPVSMAEAREAVTAAFRARFSAGLPA